MNDYIEARLDINPCSETATDIAAAILAARGYESFVPDTDGLTAYIKAELFSPDTLDIADEMPIPVAVTASHTLVPGRDWNAEWEKHYFKPIVIGNECVVHSSFHTDVPHCRLDIVIDPKMAFGTGHHATTSQMAQRLLDNPPAGARVIDMGTGTGILALIAAMQGAASVTAVEIDPAAAANAAENFALNSHPEIDLRQGGVETIADISGADLLLANINRNIITADIAAYSAALRPGATMHLSGFYEADIPVVTAAAAKCGLAPVRHTVAPEGWACLTLVKND